MKIQFEKLYSKNGKEVFARTNMIATNVHVMESNGNFVQINKGKVTKEEVGDGFGRSYGYFIEEI